MINETLKLSYRISSDLILNVIVLLHLYEFIIILYIILLQAY